VNLSDEKVKKHLCDTCRREFPTCTAKEIVFGIDLDPLCGWTKEADRVDQCDKYEVIDDR
jgi:hypothetical protein